MAGLLDLLTGGGDPAKQQGLLEAAAALMQAGQPTRAPVSTMQALNNAQRAYQGGQQDYAQTQFKNQSLEQALQLNGIKLKDAESDLANQQLLRERQKRIAERLMAGAGGAQLPAQAGQQSPMASAMPGGAMSPNVGGPDWMQAFQQQNGLQPASQPVAGSGSAPRVNQTDAYVARLLTAAQAYAEEGDLDGANKLYEQAAKLRPKYSTDFRTAAGADGKLRNYVLADDGTFKDTGLGVAPNLTEVTLGDRKKFVDKNGIAPGTEYVIGQSADSKAADRRAAADRAAGGTEPSLNDQTLDFLAGQALRGDTSVYQNLGRGAQGAANLVALRTRVAQKAQGQGLSGGDLASIGADYQGQKAALRTSGNISARVENAIAEADQLAPLAVDAGRNVARSGFLPFGKAQAMFNTQTNDPALKKFATANNGLVSAYAGAMARGQKPTVSDYDHAREILSAAQSQEAYEATVQQMQVEMKAASAAPKIVRQHLRGDIAGQDAGHGPATTPNPVAATAPAQKFDMLPAATGFAGKRMRADNGTIYRSDGTKWIKE